MKRGPGPGHHRLPSNGEAGAVAECTAPPPDSTPPDSPTPDPRLLTCPAFHCTASVPLPVIGPPVMPGAVVLMAVTPPPVPVPPLPRATARSRPANGRNPSAQAQWL